MTDGARSANWWLIGSSPVKKQARLFISSSLGIKSALVRSAYRCRGRRLFPEIWCSPIAALYQAPVATWAAQVDGERPMRGCGPLASGCMVANSETEPKGFPLGTASNSAGRSFGLVRHVLLPGAWPLFAPACPKGSQRFSAHVVDCTAPCPTPRTRPSVLTPLVPGHATTFPPARS